MIKEIAKILWSWTEYPEKAPKKSDKKRPK
mgnify:CR=1 FL=1